MSQLEWSEEQLFFNNDVFFGDLLLGIAKALHTIELETYIFRADPLGRAFESALIEAARRGVEVRLLVDGIGAMGWIDKRDPLLEKSGVQIRIYHPVRFTSILSRLLRDLGLSRRAPRRSRSALLSRLNRRTHRKMCIVDGHTTWVGSQNISSDHSEKHSGAKAWHDTAVRVSGPHVQDLTAAFDFAWIRGHTPEGNRKWSETLLQRLELRRRRISPLVRLNHTTRLRHKTFREFTGQIRRAKTRIWVTNAYLAPSTPVLRQLLKASRRGVDVRLMVPRTSDVFFMPWVASTYYKTLRRGGVRIFEYLPRFLHAKSVIIDDWAVVGTSNMNRRSLLHDFEVDIVVNKAESIEALKEQFLRDQDLCDEVVTPPRGLSGWLGRWVSYFFKNWI